MDLRPLSDDALLARLEALTGKEREGLVEVIEHIMEVDRREVVIDRGYSSLFVYCRDKLRYSDQAAFSRIRAARAARDFPEILSQMRDGTIHLDAIVRLYPHLTAENKHEILQKASGASSRKVLELIADLRGILPPLPDSIRPIAAKLPSVTSMEIIPPPRRLRFEFEADEELVLMVERLKGLLRHKYPSIRLEELFKEAAKALLDQIDPDRKPPTKRTHAQAPMGGKRSRRVPEAVKREVWRRDGGRCAYVAEDGRRCASQDALECDHIVACALGGPSDDAANIRLLCELCRIRHNSHYADSPIMPTGAILAVAEL